MSDGTSNGGGGVHSFFAKTAERMKKRQQSDDGSATDVPADNSAATPTNAARTRRKVASEPRREQTDMAKSMFFKTPAERTALKAAERERQRLANEEEQRLAAADRRQYQCSNSICLFLTFFCVFVSCASVVCVGCANR
jgi:hypothetical protein